MTLRQQLTIALRGRSYGCLHAGFFTCGFHIAFLVTHMPGEVSLCGLNAGVAATSLAILVYLAAPNEPWSFDLFAAGLGAWLGGLVVVHTGSCLWMWWADAVLALGAALVNLPGREARSGQVPGRSVPTRSSTSTLAIGANQLYDAHHAK